MAARRKVGAGAARRARGVEGREVGRGKAVSLPPGVFAGLAAVCTSESERGFDSPRVRFSTHLSAAAVWWMAQLLRVWVT